MELGADLPEGTLVRVEIELPGAGEEQARDPLWQMSELAVETRIRDLATNIDQYLYGHPKASDKE